MEIEQNFNMKLIDLVSQANLIYNPCHPEHKIRGKTDTAWRNIAQELNSTVDQCQKRWRTLRTAYGKKHKKNTEAPSGSGTLPPERWQYYHQLSFLDSYIKHRGSVDNFADGSSSPQSFLDNPEDSSIESTREDNSFSSDSATAHMPANATQPEEPSCKRKKTDKQKVQTEMLSYLRQSSSHLAELQERKLDRLDHFGKFVVAQLREKPAELVEAYMKEISSLLFADCILELNVAQQST
ncbi:uncharacterized protein LOC144747588 [Ciona intestinalis]